MDKILGYWRLKENKDFDNFLIFTQTPWWQRRIALNCAINLSLRCFLKNPKGHNHYNKKVESLFYSTDENIILDNEWRQYDDIRKKYSLKDQTVNVQILGTVVNWEEKIYMNNNNLVIKYVWKEGDKTKTATQKFTKETE